MMTETFYVWKGKVIKKIKDEDRWLWLLYIVIEFKLIILIFYLLSFVSSGKFIRFIRPKPTRELWYRDDIDYNWMTFVKIYIEVDNEVRKVIMWDWSPQLHVTCVQSWYTERQKMTACQILMQIQLFETPVW